MNSWRQQIFILSLSSQMAKITYMLLDDTVRCKELSDLVKRVDNGPEEEGGGVGAIIYNVALIYISSH